MKDLDTLYEASEQQLSVLPTESREGASSIESMTADLTKTAKLLPELRVSRTVPTPQASLTWCVCGSESGDVWTMSRHSQEVREHG